jgi:gamma-glutamyltranspeptidase/glutathione hydrolase
MRFPAGTSTFVTLASLAVVRVTVASQSPLPPLSGNHGGVVTEVGECSNIGVKTMKAGGNAADAILASALCVGTISAYHSGIGGGGFMLVRFPTPSGRHAYEMASALRCAHPS